MINIVIMDSDVFVKLGISTCFDNDAINLTTVANLSDLTSSLNDIKADIVVMELFSFEDDIFDCIEYIRGFSLKWPACKLVVYTQVDNYDALKLLIAVTDHKNIIFKNESIAKLPSRILLS